MTALFCGQISATKGEPHPDDAALVTRRKPRLLIFIVAYFAELTIAQVVRRIPAELLQTYDIEVLIIDDESKDATFAEGVGIGRDSGVPFNVTVLHNPVNQGYGGNQKIGYRFAIENNFDFVALLHGDGQYDPGMLGKLTEPLRNGEADAVLGSRMLVPKDALKGGMPLYKYVGNRVLTFVQNGLVGIRLSEFHSGYRVYAVSALKQIPFERNSLDFHFDTEIIIQLTIAGKRIKEIAIPTYYGDEISRVNGLKYAFNAVKVSLQARFQQINLFYDRRFDCAPSDYGRRYISKLEFESSHSRIIELVPEGARVLDLGSGIGAVGLALKERKGCVVVGCDIERGAFTEGFDRFVLADLNKDILELPNERFDYILALDVIEHLASPEDFLDQVRELAARSGARLVLTTANIAFIVMRLSLLLGRFEYGKRGILDITHSRLFTFNTLRRAMRAAGFEVEHSEGIVVPMPFIFGRSALSRIALVINHALVRLRPKLFGFQILMVAAPRPTLATLLDAAKVSADEKMPEVIAMHRQRLHSSGG
jgi:glycosyltransferase involved in cell wall biosynthesis